MLRRVMITFGVVAIVAYIALAQAIQNRNYPGSDYHLLLTLIRIGLFVGSVALSLLVSAVVVKVLKLDHRLPRKQDR